MSEHEHKQESTVLKLLEHLPRATAPVDFEETTLLRAMLSSLPRASAPEGFEEQVLSACEGRKERYRFRLRRWRPSRTWLAIGVGVAIVAAVTYYLFLRPGLTHQTQTSAPPAPVVLPLQLPNDTSIEEKLSPSPPPSVRSRPQRQEQPSTAPTKTVTPGMPEHDDE